MSQFVSDMPPQIGEEAKRILFENNWQYDAASGHYVLPRNGARRYAFGPKAGKPVVEETPSPLAI